MVTIGLTMDRKPQDGDLGICAGSFLAPGVVRVALARSL